MRHRNLSENYFEEKAFVACRLKRSEKSIFLSENPNEICDRVCLIIQAQQAGSDTNRFENGIVAVIDKVLEHKCFTPKQREKKCLNSIYYTHMKTKENHLR